LLFLASGGHLASQEPILGAGSDSCAEILNRDPELRNFQNGWEHHEIRCEREFFVSGRHTALMEDGTEPEFGPRDLAIIQPGDDAWVVGDEPNVLLALSGATQPCELSGG